LGSHELLRKRGAYSLDFGSQCAHRCLLLT
jgi:hypothetical protein